MFLGHFSIKCFGDLGFLSQGILECVGKLKPEKVDQIKKKSVVMEV